MSLRRINITLWIVSAVLATGALAVVALGIFVPLSAIASTSFPQSTASRPGAPSASSTTPSVESMEPVFARLLRPQIGDVPPATDITAAAQTSQAPPPSQLLLVGTIGNTIAMIKGPDGTVALVEVGDDVDGANVVAIRPSQVDLKQNGQVTSLKKSPTEASQ